MSAYPGYTVRGIQAELSWREVELLLRNIEDRPTAHLLLQRIEVMAEKKFGFEFKKPGEQILNDDELLDRLRGYGYIP